jgi:hypothetical protein
MHDPSKVLSVPPKYNHLRNISPIQHLRGAHRWHIIRYQLDMTIYTPCGEDLLCNLPVGRRFNAQARFNLWFDLWVMDWINEQKYFQPLETFLHVLGIHVRSGVGHLFRSGIRLLPVQLRSVHDVHDQRADFFPDRRSTVCRFLRSG